MSRTLASSLADAALDGADAVADTVVTLAGRLPILASQMLSPSAEALAEWHGAGSEKVLATIEAAEAALSGWQDLMWRALLAPITPAGMAHEAFRLAEAIAEPGRRRLRANAARFAAVADPSART